MPKNSKPAEHPALAAIRNAPGHRVKVAVSDIDGVLRGKAAVAWRSCTNAPASRKKELLMATKHK